MRPPLQQLESISLLLRSSAEATRALGLELLLQHPEYVQAMRRELILSTFFAEESATEQSFRQVLGRYFNPKIVAQQFEGFAIFRAAQRYVYYPKNSMELYGLLRKHENIRSDYSALLEQNQSYLWHYLPVVECIREKLPQQWKIAETYCEWVLAHIPQAEPFQQERSKLRELLGS